MNPSPRKVNLPLVLYGTGKLGSLAQEIFTELNIPIHAIISKDISIPPTESLVAICVASSPYYPIRDFLVKQGWTKENIVPVYDIIDAYPEVGIRNGWFTGEMTEEEKLKFAQVAIGLEDHASAKHYMAFVEWHMDRTVFTPVDINTAHNPSLPSTLADIRARQCIGLMHDGIWKNRIDFHLEGYEYESLVINMDLLQKHRPSLSVACYHSRDGLYKIEKFCMENLADYRWTFRLTAWMGQGAYLYGTPKERT